MVIIIVIIVIIVVLSYKIGNFTGEAVFVVAAFIRPLAVVPPARVRSVIGSGAVFRVFSIAVVWLISVPVTINNRSAVDPRPFSFMTLISRTDPHGTSTIFDIVLSIFVFCNDQLRVMHFAHLRSLGPCVTLSVKLDVTLVYHAITSTFKFNLDVNNSYFFAKQRYSFLGILQLFFE